MRAGEGVNRGAIGVNPHQIGIGFKRGRKPPRIEHLRDKANVGNSWCSAAKKGCGRISHHLKRIKPFANPVAIPIVPSALINAKRTPKIFEDAQVVDRMNVRSNRQRQIGRAHV